MSASGPSGPLVFLFFSVKVNFEKNNQQTTKAINIPTVPPAKSYSDVMLCFQRSQGLSIGRSLVY